MQQYMGVESNFKVVNQAVTLATPTIWVEFSLFKCT